MAVAWFLVCPRKDYKNYYAQGKKTIWTTIVYYDCHTLHVRYSILYCIHHEICLKLLIVLSVLLGVTVSVNALVAFVAQVE